MKPFMICIGIFLQNIMFIIRSLGSYIKYMTLQMDSIKYLIVAKTGLYIIMV